MKMRHFHNNEEKIFLFSVKSTTQLQGTKYLLINLEQILPIMLKEYHLSEEKLCTNLKKKYTLITLLSL